MFQPPTNVHEELFPELQKKLEFKGTAAELEQRIIFIQRSVRHFLVYRKFLHLVSDFKDSKPAKDGRQRTRVLKEIVDTELSYTSSLRVLVEEFQAECNDFAQQYANAFIHFKDPVITEKECAELFSNIAILRDFHETFYASLLHEYQNWPAKPCQYGAVFVRLSSFLKMYTEYTKNYTVASDLLAKLLRRPAFKEWLAEKESTTHQFLNSLLISPVQRIPRYRLLLQELLKFTPEEHVDRNALESGLEKIREVADHVNETQRGSENMAELAEIQTSVNGLFVNLVNPSRRVLERGILIRSTKEGARQRRYFYLFNDMMLSCSVAQGRRVYEDRKVFKGAVLGEANLDRVFSINYPNVGLITYQCDSEEEKQKWLKSVTIAIDESAMADVKDAAAATANEALAKSKSHKQGYLLFLGGALRQKSILFSKWRKKWFVLSNDVLYYYENSNDTAPQGCFQLEYWMFHEMRGYKGKDFVWEMNLPPNNRHIAAETETDFNSWLLALRDCTKHYSQPITNLAVIFKDADETPPPGYTCIEQSPSGLVADLNRKSGGRQIFLCFERGGMDEDGTPMVPITHVEVIFTDKKVKPREEPSDHFVRLDKTYWKKIKADLNAKSGGRELFLCYRRDPCAAPITNLAIVIKSEGEHLPRDFKLLEYTASGNWAANLNSGSGGSDIFLAWKSSAPPEEIISEPYLAWNSKDGFDVSAMPSSWRRLCQMAGATEQQLRDPHVSRVIIETVNLNYYRIKMLRTESSPSVRMTTMCYNCHKYFGFQPPCRAVSCPYCGVVNSTPAGTPGRPLMASANYPPPLPAEAPLVSRSIEDTSHNSDGSSFPGDPHNPYRPLPVQPQQANILQCFNCRGQFRYPPNTPVVACPFCQRPNTVPQPSTPSQPPQPMHSASFSGSPLRTLQSAPQSVSFNGYPGHAMGMMDGYPGNHPHHPPHHPALQDTSGHSGNLGYPGNAQANSTSNHAPPDWIPVPTRPPPPPPSAELEVTAGNAVSEQKREKPNLDLLSSSQMELLAQSVQAKLASMK